MSINLHIFPARQEVRESERLCGSGLTRTVNLFAWYCGTAVFVLLLAGTHITRAATIYAASASRADVGRAYAAAADGDTVVVPAGSANWATVLIISNAITLQGAGIGNTVIRDDVPSGSLIYVTLKSNRTTRITGFEFQVGTRVTVQPIGTVNLNGSNETTERVRLDHCKFDNLNGFALEVNGALGVIDHNEILFNKQVGFGYIRHRNFNGGAYGDNSWVADDLFGSDQFIFIEDNTITCTLAGWHLTTVDGWGGSRYVFRNNTLTRGSLEMHGTESGGRNRGGRAFEIYRNNFVGGNFGGIVAYMRSGVGLIWSNRVSSYSANNMPFYLLNNRNTDAYPPFGTGNAEWSGADGQNPWDVNAPGGPFASGTVIAYESGAQTCTLTVSGTPWTNNQWQGYSITRTSGKSISSLTRSGSTVTARCTNHGFSTEVISIRGANQPVYNTIAGITVLDANTFTYVLDFGAGSPASPATGTIYAIAGGYFSEVRGNTTNSITFKASVFGAARTLAFGVGDTFALWKVNQAMDQPGRKGGSGVSKDTPSRPVGWNDQTTSPWYEWGNTRESGVDLDITPYHLTIRSGEHFHNDTTAPGYTPYTYPHPLVTPARSITLPPPSGLRTTNAPP